ncbi:MAG: DUF302 domain-containing protein [Xanthobacteraceae bacterium]
MDSFQKALCSLVMLLAGIGGAVAAGAKVTHHAEQIEHIRIVSAKPFDEIAAALERSLPDFDPAISQALAEGDEVRAKQIANGHKLFIFRKRNFGELLKVVGRPAKARQYEIGNPITATRMTQHQLAAALYAPLRAILYEDPSGGSTFEYDRPSTLFGQFGDKRVTSVARELDAELADALQQAAR